MNTYIVALVLGVFFGFALSDAHGINGAERTQAAFPAAIRLEA